MKMRNIRPLIKRGLSNLNIGYIIILVSFVSGLFSALVTGQETPVKVQEVQEAWIPLAALAISAGLSVAKGWQQKKLANDIAKNNTKPEFRISRGTLQNLTLAREALNRGMGSTAYQKATDQLGLGLSSALRNNILYGGGNTNAGSLLRVYNQGVTDLNIEDEKAKERNRAAFMEANKDLAAEERFKYQSELQDYQNTAKMSADLRRAGDENLFGAANTILSGVASGAFGNVFKGASLKATAPTGVTPSISHSAIGASLANQKAAMVKAGLNNPTLQGDSAFWKSAGLLRK